MSRLSLLLVLLIVLTAGCNGLPGDSSAPDREPYDVDEPLESSLSSPGANVAGVTEAGIENDSFVRDHHAVLANQSYTTSQATTATLANETVLLEDERSTRLDATSRHQLTRIETTGNWDLNVHESDRVQRIQRYVSEEDDRPVARIEHGNGTVEYERGYRLRANPSLFSILRPLRDAEEIEIERQRYADGKYTVVTGTKPVGTSQYLDDDRFFVQALIRDDGLIRYATVEATIRHNGERVHIDQEHIVDDLGETTVERPDWYDEALEELGRTEEGVAVSEATFEE